MRTDNIDCRPFTITVLAVVAHFLIGNVATAQNDVLRPEAAFPYTLEASADEITLTFQVQEGYYLYRERFDFESLTNDVVLGAAQFPEGIIHEDEFFGVVETYRNQFQIQIPYQFWPVLVRLTLIPHPSASMFTTVGPPPPGGGGC